MYNTLDRFEIFTLLTLNTIDFFQSLKNSQLHFIIFLKKLFGENKLAKKLVKSATFSLFYTKNQ